MLATAALTISFGLSAATAVAATALIIMPLIALEIAFREDGLSEIGGRAYI